MEGVYNGYGIPVEETYGEESTLGCSGKGVAHGNIVVASRDGPGPSLMPPGMLPVGKSLRWHHWLLFSEF